MKNGFIRLAFFFAVFCLFFSSGAALAAEGGKETGPEQAAQAEAGQTELTAMAITKLVASHQGKVVVLSFYAAWCPPCRKEIPLLIKLRQEFSEDELVIIGLSLDDTPVAYQRFVEMMGFNYPTYRVAPAAASFFEISSIPEVFYYSPAGRLEKRVVGLETEARIRGRITEYLSMKE